MWCAAEFPVSAAGLQVANTLAQRLPRAGGRSVEKTNVVQSTRSRNKLLARILGVQGLPRSWVLRTKVGWSESRDTGGPFRGGVVTSTSQTRRGARHIRTSLPSPTSPRVITIAITQNPLWSSLRIPLPKRTLGEENKVYNSQAVFPAIFKDPFDLHDASEPAREQVRSRTHPACLDRQDNMGQK